MTLPPDDARFMVPSALNTNSWQLWICSILYLCTSFFACFESIRAFLVPKGFRTYRFNFLGLSFLFSLLRGIMTLVAFPGWKNNMIWLYFLNLFLPNFLLYYIFSLLALFVIQVFMMFNSQEDKVESFLFRIYHTIQFFLLVGCVLASYFLGKMFEDEPDTSNRVKSWDQIASIYNVLLYGFLTLIGGYFSYRCYHIVSTLMLSDRQRVQQKRYLLLTILFCVIFCCRFLWCVLYFAGMILFESFN